VDRVPTTSTKETVNVFGKARDRGTPLEEAMETASGLKAGTWTSVEALSMLSIEVKGRPEAAGLYASARDASAGLSSGSWESVRALTWLARAGRELGEG
jgi:hypothetical protein